MNTEVAMVLLENLLDRAEKRRDGDFLTQKEILALRVILGAHQSPTSAASETEVPSLATTSFRTSDAKKEGTGGSAKDVVLPVVAGASDGASAHRANPTSSVSNLVADPTLSMERKSELIDGVPALSDDRERLQLGLEDVLAAVRAIREAPTSDEATWLLKNGKLVTVRQLADHIGCALNDVAPLDRAAFVVDRIREFNSAPAGSTDRSGTELASSQGALSLANGAIQSAAVLREPVLGEYRPPLHDALSVVWRGQSQVDDNLVLGVDFGTALSKAFAILDGPDPKWYDLALGKYVGDASSPYPLPSSLWIDGNGTVHFGRSAIERSNAQETLGAYRPRLDSLKQWLSHGNGSAALLESEISRELNPLAETVRFTYRDAITVLLAYLLDCAQGALRVFSGAVFPAVRFAVPCFRSDEMDAVASVLRELLPRALVLADSLRGKRVWSDGIQLVELQQLLEEIARTPDRLPHNIILAQLPEAVAAGQGVLRTHDSQKRIAIIIDVGAGTTDFAAFHVVEDDQKEVFRFSVVRDSVRAIRKAGDHVDNIIKGFLRQTHPDAPLTALAPVMGRVRQLKERLFTAGTADYTLADGTQGKLELAEVLRLSAMNDLEGSFRAEFNKVLEAIGPDMIRGREICVVFTGGGASLPVIRALVEGGVVTLGGITARVRTLDAVPAGVRGKWDEDFVAAYPQLAVAIGAASKHVPTLGREFSFHPAPTPGPLQGFRKS